ncbi:membrane protein insertase YidC [Sediminibacterium sp. TEGAF015]|uniref:membrane protein insertase YidC n=1 Tax=Sediminibacterium sp. TEGAF015 TaxID=575378 RepID=UPI00220770BB|nr:membrane protein insertase YidC [Sediminibacterium sp. TEGAF015]BDQ10847.1 membrane protein insertase YidC [Sediminibacterium sp. TEGAF015]
MKTDKNTVIGFVLLGILMFLYFWYTSQQQNAIIEMKKREEDSLAKVAAARMKMLDTVAIKVDSLKRDSAVRVASAGNFTDAAIGQETVITLENEVVKVNLTNKGAQIKSVVLKQYKDAQHQPVVLSNKSILAYAINTAPAQSAGIENLYFTPGEIVKNSDGSQTLQFKLASVNGQSVLHTFTLSPNSYKIGWKLGMNGAAQLLTNQQLNLNWTVATEQMERTSQYERQVSNICFSEDNEFDYISSNTDHTFEKPAQWVSVVQQFFNSTLIADNSFNSGSIKWARATDSSKNLANTTSSLQVKVPAAATVEIPFHFYVGPNEYDILSKQAPEMDKIINLGRDMYSFVRPINKYIIMPVFDFFASFVKNYGWVIFLLTLFIRLVTAPLTYSSYLSGAKMKALRPELDVLKKKMGDDQQGFAMEQMKLFREAGVNPLGGCIPALLQIPIFFALYSFFNSQIALRGQSFLWSADLSSYDSIASLPFSIPAFGNHVSLFTITAVLTSFLISIYNMSMTPTQDNPALKYMPYIFPFMLLFIFNSLPSALTWYYTVSNVITLLLQFVIQNYIIDHDKILAKIEAKRKAPKSKSKWQERYEQMVESQKKLQELKNKTNKK